MSITVLSRWKGSREDILRISGKMKPIAERGIFDRVDGIMFAAPAMAALLLILPIEVFS